jgi:hypothetical protein
MNMTIDTIDYRETMLSVIRNAIVAGVINLDDVNSIGIIHAGMGSTLTLQTAQTAIDPLEDDPEFGTLLIACTVIGNSITAYIDYQSSAGHKRTDYSYVGEFDNLSEIIKGLRDHLHDESL